MRTSIGETLVEWDDNKNLINIRKHGISFETAALVFADEERIEYYDKLHSLEEDPMSCSDVYKVFCMSSTRCGMRLRV